MFREDIESEEKYEKSIAEWVKTRRDTQRTFAPSSPPKEDYSAETDEYDSNGQSSGSGLKILTNKQMLNRLPILLAQIQAGNNSKKLKNEIRNIILVI